MQLKKILIIFIIAGLIAAVKISGYDRYLTFTSLINSKEILTVYVNENFLISVVVFICVYIFVIALSIPGAVILTLAGGFLFSYWGIIYVITGATIGAALAFLTARNVLGDWIQNRYADKLKDFNREIKSNGPSYLLTLRFIPVFPFWLINLSAGISGVSLFTFIWTTFIGIIPGSAVYIYAGTQLGSIKNPGDIFSFRILMIFLLFTLLAIIPVVIKKIKNKPEGKNEN
jgi:uncharacterized membrane protein YdjX (TVP38/TMEM64 family)